MFKQHLPKSSPSHTDHHSRIREIALVFLKLGFTGFGGAAVHLAMMEEEIVHKRGWMNREHFMDLVGATNLIPGPNSTEMALHCGHERAGSKGLLVAGTCFILPAVGITIAFAWGYQHYGTLPEVRPFIYGIQPAIIGIIMVLTVRLARTAIKNLTLGLIAASALLLSILGINEIMVLFGSGFLGMLIFWERRNRSILHSVMPSTMGLFWIFLKVGATLYGSGYVLFAFLNNELIKTGILSRQVLTDAIAVGQFTPGPLFSSATFIGWQIGGWRGAIAATVGIFLPSFLFVGLINPFVFRLRRSKSLSAFLDAINVASIALILAVCITLAKTAIAGWHTIAIALSGALVSFTFPRLNSAWVILGGALTGYLLHLL